MARKKDPIVGVLQFFRTASLEVTAMALALVKAEVRARTPVPVVKPRRRSIKPTGTFDPRDVAPAILPPSTPPPAATGTPGHRMPRRMRADSPRPPKEQDLALPGLHSGTVGD